MVVSMGNRYSKRKPAHLDYNPREEKRLVYSQQTGEFKEPINHFIKAIPLDLVAPLYALPKSAVFTWLACWFLHGCNKGKPFTLNSSTARRFGLNRQNRRRGLCTLEKAGFLKMKRRPGRLSLIEMAQEEAKN